MPTTIGFTDPRKEEGQLLWPARFPESVQAQRLKEMTTRGVAAQDQQRPTPAGGGLFKRDFIKYWKVFPRSAQFFMQSWDCAFKGLDSSDHVVGQLWAMQKGDFFLLDQVRAKLTVYGTINAVTSLSAKWPQARLKAVEDKANGPAVTDMLKHEIPGLVLVNPRGGKWVRANAVEPLWASGNVYIPHPTIAQWVPYFEDEFERFNGQPGMEDDQIDAMTQALNYMYRKSIARYRKAMENFY